MHTLEDFRAETRAWLEQNCPDGAKGPGQTPLGSKSIELEPDVRTWLDRMSRKGWTVPTWPVEYGGAALNNDEYKILIEELKRVGARTPLTGRGVNYIGPTILGRMKPLSDTNLITTAKTDEQASKPVTGRYQL